MEATRASAKSGRACTHIERSGRIEHGGHLGREWSASRLGHRVMREKSARGYRSGTGKSTPGRGLSAYSTGTAEVARGLRLKRFLFPPRPHRGVGGGEIRSRTGDRRRGRNNRGRKSAVNNRGVFWPLTVVYDGSGPLSGRKLRFGPALWCPLFMIEARFLAPKRALVSPL